MIYITYMGKIKKTKIVEKHIQGNKCPFKEAHLSQNRFMISF